MDDDITNQYKYRIDTAIFHLRHYQKLPQNRLEKLENMEMASLVTFCLGFKQEHGNDVEKYLKTKSYMKSIGEPFPPAGPKLLISLGKMYAKVFPL